jgi:hypothetical protein
MITKAYKENPILILKTEDYNKKINNFICSNNFALLDIYSANSYEKSCKEDC